MPKTASPKDYAKFHAWFSNFVKKFNGKNGTSMSPARRKALQQAWKNWQKWYREWNQAFKRYSTISQKLNQFQSQSKRLVRFNSPKNNRTSTKPKGHSSRPNASPSRSKPMTYKAWIRSTRAGEGQWQVWIGWTAQGTTIPVWEFPSWGKSAIIQVKVGNGRWKTIYEGKKFPYKFNLNVRSGAKVQFRGAILYGNNKRTPWAGSPAFTYLMAA